MKRREVISNVFNEYKNYSSQIFKLATADLKKTYNGSALGWAWAVIKPLTTILVFWFAFSVGLRSGKNIYPVPYVLWIIAGMVPFTPVALFKLFATTARTRIVSPGVNFSLAIFSKIFP